MTVIYVIGAIALGLLVWEFALYAYPEIRCFLDGGHRPVRHLIGMRCRVCGKPGASLEDFEK